MDAKDNQSESGSLVDFVIIPESNLAIERFQGRVDHHIIRIVSKRIWELPGYTRTLNALIDLRGCKIQLSSSEVLRLVAFFFSSPSSIRGRTAIVVDSPKNTAISLFFQSRMLLLTKTQVVSNITAAYRFLNASPNGLSKLESNEALHWSFSENKEMVE